MFDYTSGFSLNSVPAKVSHEICPNGVCPLNNDSLSVGGLRGGKAAYSLIGGAADSEKKKQLPEVSADDAKKILKRNSGVVMLHMPDCPFCTKMEEVLLEVIDELSEDMKIIAVKVNGMERGVAKEFGDLFGKPILGFPFVKYPHEKEPKVGFHSHEIAKKMIQSGSS